MSYAFRFAAFAYFDYYPRGGMRDCVGTFASKGEARAFLRENYSAWDHQEVHDLVKSASKPFKRDPSK